ncbi:Putative aliphatic sulfonates transport permease protein SsuC [Baekduia alba]|uniref:ABC transporter permease n=1 Tax=Baekduia alba TaxID=2997333 RepID=UPI002341B907|nr:ABC transporter permease [Baekduia alba]WCB96206.1 Putative aliphatic sulfonates transport permease protein SsuC [Baekduia alba]
MSATPLKIARRTSGVLIILALWELSTAVLGLFEPNVLPSPATVLTTFEDLVAHGDLVGQVGTSVRRALIGVVLGVTTGATLGALSGLWRRGEDLIDAPVQMLQAVPFTAIVPLFIVWFGIGELPKILIIAFGAAFPMYLNVYGAIRNVDVKLVEAARVFGLTKPQLIRHVILPAAVQPALVALRQSMAISVVALVAAEQLNASSGIGFILGQAREFLRADIVLVCIAIYAALGLTGDLIARTLERRLLGWRRTYRGA